jgi:hypothetical protein
MFFSDHVVSPWALAATIYGSRMCLEYCIDRPSILRPRNPPGVINGRLNCGAALLCRAQVVG